MPHAHRETPSDGAQLQRGTHHVCGWLPLLVFALWGAACDGNTQRAKLVEPVFGDACELATCSPHGECRADEAGAPTCLCQVGYTGATCAACEPGFHRDSMDRCVTDKSCAEQPADPCGANGDCVNQQGVIACMCDSGYEGPRCTLCAERYGRDDQGRCLPLFLTPSADGGVAGGGPRSCPAGYAGSSCADCAVGYHRFGGGCTADEVCEANTCAQQGMCEVLNGEASCSCSSGYAGEHCGRCATSYHVEGSTCVADESCQLNSCSARSVCSINAGKVACSCAAGYAGTDCGQCAIGYHARSGNCVQDEVCQAGSCGSRASCQVTEGEIVCDCHDGYSGEGCAACAAGYHATGNGVCMKDAECKPSSCPAHASCRIAAGLVACDCHAGYLGVGCDFCSFGYHKRMDGSCVPDETCKDTICPLHAYCVVAGGQAQCPCEIGWAGAMCDRCTDLVTHTTQFSSVPNWPIVENTCSTRRELVLGPLAMRSRQGTGDVFLCAPSTFNGLKTQHLELEALADRPAVLQFEHPIASIAFDYAARLNDLDLQVLADGNTAGTIKLTKKSKGSLSLQLAPSARVITLRSMSAYGQAIGIDNVTYQIEQCEKAVNHDVP